MNDFDPFIAAQHRRKLTTVEGEDRIRDVPRQSGSQRCPQLQSHVEQVRVTMATQEFVPAPHVFCI